MRIVEHIKTTLLRNRYVSRLDYFNPCFSRIEKFRDCHRGERAFVLGSGPSLRIDDLDRLKNEVTFGCNKIYLAFNQTEWRPTYYSVIDSMVARNNIKAINSCELVKIFSNSIRVNFLGRNDIFWLQDVRNQKIDDKIQFGFSTDLTRGVYGGYTVIYTMLQMAYFMGIREVYLLGLDFSFDVPKPSQKKSPHGETLLYSNGEINHFHPEYRPKGEVWTMPRMDLQYQAFSAAREAFESDGRVIYNASRQTMLDVFPLVNLDDIL